MVNTSKILTVSYGTFSCTLEGFDDSFDTMKAIAEYFRDLAADDRYFGAEPPAPDADMLARIAEREIARRVEAHENEGKIVLRAGDAPALAGLAAAQAPQHQPAEETPASKPHDQVEEPASDDTAASQPPEDMQDATEEVTEPVEADDAVVENETVENETPIAHAPDETEAGDAASAESDHAVDDTSPAADEGAEDTQHSDVQEAVETEAEDEPEPAPQSDTAAEAPAEHDPESETEAQEVAAEDEPSAASAEPPEAEPIAAAVEDQPDAESDSVVVADQPEAESDSVAAKLRRIRSVVSHAEQDYGDSDYTEDEHAEDEHAQDFVDATAAELDDALGQDEAADIAEEAQAEPEQMPDDSDDLDALLARFDDDTNEDAMASTPDSSEPEPQSDSVDLAEDTLAQLLADAMPAQDDPQDRPEEAEDDEGAPLRLGPDSAVDTVDTADKDGSADNDPTEAVDVAEDTDDQPEGQPVLRARVVKMKRSEFEAALAEGYIEEDEDETETWNVFNEATRDDGDNSDSDESGLSSEEEAELQRELAEVEAELRMDATPEQDATLQDIADAQGTQPDKIDPADQAQPQADSQPAGEQDDSAPRGRDKLDHEQAPPADVNRIFEKADTHLEEPESNQRRSVIRHLRAAVAATRAEKNAGSDLDKNVDDTPYRSDLQEVVRPRRPQAGGAARSARPEDQRAAPLKLVAEQRVDAEAPREPVRPRRIASATMIPAQTADLATDSGFADFAEQMGATRLPDLLEAAAAYLSDVEGRPQFSRPMLMGKLKEVSQDSFSREDGLRSFGQLLRDGKLQKLKGGRFAVTDETDFRDEARNAG
ncbi:hypothetical protein [Roseovarius gahaiensis]